MRNLFAVLSIFLSVFLYSQASSNPFSNEKEQARENSEYSSSGRNVDYGDTRNNAAQDDDGPPNPGNPVPVDQYAGLLLFTAVGIIIYTAHKKRKLLTRTY